MYKLRIKVCNFVEVVKFIYSPTWVSVTFSMQYARKSLQISAASLPLLDELDFKQLLSWFKYLSIISVILNESFLFRASSIDGHISCNFQGSSYYFNTIGLASKIGQSEWRKVQPCDGIGQWVEGIFASISQFAAKEII